VEDCEVTRAERAAQGASLPGPAGVSARCENPMAMKPRCTDRARAGDREWPQRCGSACAVLSARSRPARRGRARRRTPGR
jgi:hypothetical protein